MYRYHNEKICWREITCSALVKFDERCQCVTGHKTRLSCGGNATIPNGQVLDIHWILNGINAIKCHQTTISVELNELKRSNQLLWQDTLAARARHQKQQDTINRIVKFLVGVFGNHAAAGAGGVSVSGGPTNIAEGQHGNPDGVDGALGGLRKRARLMIEDARKDGTKSMIEELTEIPIEPDTPMQYSAYSRVSRSLLNLTRLFSCRYPNIYSIPITF